VQENSSACRTGENHRSLKYARYSSHWSWNADESDGKADLQIADLLPCAKAEGIVPGEFEMGSCEGSDAAASISATFSIAWDAERRRRAIVVPVGTDRAETFESLMPAVVSV